MIKLKSIVLCIILFFALAFVLFFLSNKTITPDANQLEILNVRMQEGLQGRLLSAEESLKQQATALSYDTQFVNELSLVRDKLLSATPTELKHQTKNTWNNQVFERLLDWREKRNSAINQQKNLPIDPSKDAIGSVSRFTPIANWWQKGPDLALAFAAVPMKSGELSATLVANAIKGKELQGGKRYDEDLPSLRHVLESQTSQFDLIAWDGKMYFAIVSPISSNNALIGLTVLGMELSSEFAARLESTLPSFVKLLVVYSSPKIGVPGKRFLFSSDANAKANLETAKFVQNSGDTPVKFDEITSNKVYENTPQATQDCRISRLVWTWNENAQADIYTYIDLDAAKSPIRHLNTYIGILCAIAGILAIFVVMITASAFEKRLKTIRKAFADALSNATPMDTDALSALMGENAEALGNVTIQRHIEASNDGDGEQDWSNLMMDLDDASNAKSDSEMSSEDLETMKKNADIQEATALYDEYMARRKENNINTPMDFDCFLRRLQRNIQKIKTTYKCKEVHFEIHVSDGNVLLKPKIVK